MKIAVLNIYSGLMDRGAETVAKSLADNWATEHDIMFFAGGAITKTEFKTKIIPGIGVILPESNGGLVDKIEHWLYNDEYSAQVREFTRRAMEDLEKFNPDVVLSLNGSEQVRILHQSSILRNKVVVSMQGQTENRRWKLAGRENNRLIDLSPRGMIAINALQFELLKSSKNNNTEIDLIPNGVDIDFFNPQAVESKIGLKSPVVLCVAGLQPYKRIDRLIKAVKLTDFSLLVLGEGPLRQELEILGTHLLGRERFEIMTVPHDLIPGIYTACDIFSLPSKPLEAFGVAYLEAMACNLAIVAPDDPVRRGIVGEAGLYVNVENDQEYAKTLTRAKTISWGDKPRNQAMKFEWGKISQKYIEFFNRIV